MLFIKEEGQQLCPTVVGSTSVDLIVKLRE